MEVKCEQVATLQGGKWDKMHDIAKRVYGTDDIAPTLHTCGGGNLEPKIAEPLAYDEQNQYVRRDGTVGTLTTDGSSPKHNNRIVEPQEIQVYDGFNQQVRAAQSTVGALTRNVGADLKRNGQGIVERENYNFRVRKLTERECFKLMGVKVEDFEKVRQNQSKSSCYHLAGDSIMTPCLMALFGQMLGVDWNKKVNELVQELIK